MNLNPDCIMQALSEAKSPGNKEGRWVTMRGRAVFIPKGGKPQIGGKGGVPSSSLAREARTSAITAAIEAKTKGMTKKDALTHLEMRKKQFIKRKMTGARAAIRMIERKTGKGNITHL